MSLTSWDLFASESIKSVKRLAHFYKLSATDQTSQSPWWEFPFSKKWCVRKHLHSRSVNAFQLWIQLTWWYFRLSQIKFYKPGCYPACRYTVHCGLWSCCVRYECRTIYSGLDGKFHSFSVQGFHRKERGIQLRRTQKQRKRLHCTDISDLPKNLAVDSWQMFSHLTNKQKQVFLLILGSS